MLPSQIANGNSTRSKTRRGRFPGLRHYSRDTQTSLWLLKYVTKSVGMLRGLADPMRPGESRLYTVRVLSESTDLEPCTNLPLDAPGPYRIKTETRSSFACQYASNSTAKRLGCRIKTWLFPYSRRRVAPGCPGQIDACTSTA
jgi:hypothetical protein